MKQLSAYRRLFGLLPGHRRLVIAFVVMALLASAAEGLGVGLVIPLLEGWRGDASHWVHKIPLLGVFGRFFHALSLADRVRLVAVVLFFIVLVQSGLRYVERLVALQLHVRIERALKREAILQLYRVSLQFIQRKSAGDLLTVLVMHTRQAANVVTVLASIVANASILVVYAALMLVLSWQLTLVAAGLLVPLALLNQRLSADQLRKEGEAQNLQQRKVRKVMIESLSLMKLSHLYAQEHRSIERADQVFDKYLHHFYESQKLIHRATPLFSVSAVFGLSLLLIAGTYLLPDQTEAWLARTVLFLLIVFRLLSPATVVNRMCAELCNYQPSLESVLEFLNSADKPYLTNGNIAFTQLEHQVALDNVTFRYSPHEAPVLKNVTFSIPRGKVTALVGASGSGKSTIINLVARLYDCDEGCIRADAFDLRDLDIASWRNQLAVVSQDTLLSNDTLMANLRFARPDATDQEVYQAVCLAQLQDFVTELPQGYDTRIGDHGVRLSGGQQQRVAIARALVADPQLLILDEATSALDSETERAIQTALEEFGKSRTFLVAAHRLSTIRKADNIVVLANAQVIQQGTHAQLMECNGLYRQLVETQIVGHDPGFGQQVGDRVPEDRLREFVPAPSQDS